MDRESVIRSEQPSQNLRIGHPAVMQNGERAGQLGQGPLITEELGRDRQHMAGADPRRENLAVLDQLANVAEPKPHPLTDVGDGEPLAHQLLEIVVVGCVGVVVVFHGSRMPRSWHPAHHVAVHQGP